MEEDILNYSPTVMFRTGHPVCTTLNSGLYIIVKGTVSVIFSDPLIGAAVIKEYSWYYFDILRVKFFIYKFNEFAAVQNFKYGIKNHQVPNVECARKNVPNIASEPFEVRKQYGDLAQCRKSKRNTVTISNKIYKVFLFPARSSIVKKKMLMIL